jgi:hypothetical protein
MERIERREFMAAEASAAVVATPERKSVRPFVRSLAAAVGIFSGIAALFVGLVCVAVHVVLPHDAVFDRVGSILLICAIPLMFIGSLFLDDVPSSGGRP